MTLKAGYIAFNRYILNVDIGIFHNDGSSVYMSDQIASALEKYAKLLREDVRLPYQEQKLTNGSSPWKEEFTLPQGNCTVLLRVVTKLWKGR